MEVAAAGSSKNSYGQGHKGRVQKEETGIIKMQKGDPVLLKLGHLKRRHFLTGVGFHGVENNKASFENVVITANWIHLLLWEGTAVAAVKKHC